MQVTKSNTTRDELIKLKDTDMLKWSEIMQIAKFRGIPKRTLSMIYLGKRDVPKKFRRQLGEPDTAPAPVCTACGKVHAIDRACELTVTVRRKGKPRKRQIRWGWLWDVPQNELIQMINERK